MTQTQTPWRGLPRVWLEDNRWLRMETSMWESAMPTFPGNSSFKRINFIFLLGQDSQTTSLVILRWYWPLMSEIHSVPGALINALPAQCHFILPTVFQIGTLFSVLQSGRLRLTNIKGFAWSSKSSNLDRILAQIFLYLECMLISLFCLTC